MADDLELLRLRAKAKLKVRQENESVPQEKKPALTNSQRLVQNLQTPFQQILPDNPIMQGIGKTLDLPMGIPATIAGGMIKAGQSNSVPEFMSGVTQAGAGITALPIAPFVSGMSALAQVPAVGNVLNKVSTPFQSVINPITETGQNLASTADNTLQMLMANQKPKVESMIKSAPQNISKNINSSRVNDFKSTVKRVAPPTAKELNYEQHLAKATDYIREEAKTMQFDPSVSPIRQATDVVAGAKERLWNEKIAPAIDKNKDVTVSGGEVAKAIRESISPYTKRHEPLKAEALENYARTFEDWSADGKSKVGDYQIPISELNKNITELNAKTSAFQKATGGEKALIENSNARVNGEVRAVEKMRELLYDKLDEVGSPEVRGLKQDYGSLMQVHKALERNIVKIEKGDRSSSFYAKPFGTAVAAGATLEALKNNPKVAVPALLIGAIRKVTLDRNKPQPSIERAFRNLSKSE